jgi:speckle-type POZ protein
MAEVFNWIRPGYELVTVKLERNVPLSFLARQTEIWPTRVRLQLTSPQETPNSKWQLHVEDHGTAITIRAKHFNSAGKCVDFVEPALVKMSIVNKKGTKVLQQMLSSTPTTSYVTFNLSSKDLIESKCQQSDGTFTFYCKILKFLTHVVKSKSIASSADPPVLAVDCSGGLVSYFEELFDDMSLSDFSFNIGGREFPAHKVILAARSKYFAAMFKHPTKENSTNQVNIEDIEPEVFQELLRFIYTGRLSSATMESMVANLFIAADKYLLDELKNECENYLLRHMSPDYCLVLLLHGDLQNPTHPLNVAAKFFRLSPNQVMATDGWKKLEEENLVLLREIEQFVICFRVNHFIVQKHDMHEGKNNFV